MPGTTNDVRPRRRWRLWMAAALAAAAGAALLPRLTAPDAVYCSTAPRREMALTFDAGGEGKYADPIRNILRERGVHATFFMTGKWLQLYPDIARRIAADGNEVDGNHSFSHPHMRDVPSDEIRSELQRTGELMRQVTGRQPRYFRPPFGEYDDRVLRVVGAMGYTTVMWTIDTNDWASPGVDRIVNSVMEGAGPGRIVLLHLGGPQTPDALPRIIAGLQERGYRLVTLSEALRPPQDTRFSLTLEGTRALVHRIGRRVKHLLLRG